MKCNHCKTEVAEGCRFCPNCGKEVSAEVVCANCGEKIMSGSQFCHHCGAKQPETVIANTYVEEPDNGLKKWLLIIPLIVLLVGAVAWYFYSVGFSSGAKAEAEAVDTTSVKTNVQSADETKATPREDVNKNANNNVTPNPFAGKVYKGSGYGGGLPTDMTITFLDNNKCLCKSDWYRAYSTPRTFQGKYSVIGKKLRVLCNDCEFEFDVKSNGRVIEYDNSGNVDFEGTMAINHMSLELIGNSHNTDLGMREYNDVFMHVVGMVGGEAEFVMNGNEGWYLMSGDRNKRILKLVSCNYANGHCVANAYLKGKYIGKFDGTMTVAQSSKHVQRYKGIFYSVKKGVRLDFDFYATE